MNYEATCITKRHVLRSDMYYEATCITKRHVLRSDMYYEATCITNRRAKNAVARATVLTSWRQTRGVNPAEQHRKLSETNKISGRDVESLDLDGTIAYWAGSLFLGRLLCRAWRRRTTSVFLGLCRAGLVPNGGKDGE